MARRTAPALVLAAVLAAGPIARADGGEAEGARAQAASAFDEGVARAKRADYEGAARAFLRADELMPSAPALTNALAAARKAGDHLAVAHAAERAIARADADPALAARAREALADAATHLARVEAACDAEACTLTVDGSSTPPGRSFALPGTHEYAATTAAGASATERITLAAGSTYRIVLHPVSAGAAPVRAEVVRHASEAAAPPAAERAAPVPTPRGLSPAWFFVGLGATAVLGGLTTWSGVDALAAKRALPAEPTVAAVDDVKGRMKRSDGFFVGTLVGAAATALVGLVWVDWHPSRGVGAKASALAAAPGLIAW